MTDATETVGLEGAIIRVVETGHVAAADREGGFRISGLAAGNYTLEVSYIGAEPQTVPVSLASTDSTARPEISLGENVALLENILVIGQRGALYSAISQQRSSDKVITVLSSDAIGQLPDENVAEAARRASGVNVLNDQGEGRFISIRGADPNFVTSTINGIRLPSPEADNRQVPLDVIDSDILSSIVITKSLTPDVDGDSIGGNVEIKTLSGLDQDDLFVKLKAAGIYANQVDEFGQRYSGVFANKFADGRLGIAGSIAWQQRDFGSENKEVDDSEWELGETVPFPGELEFRDYQIRRERLSASLNIDYQATDNLMVYLHGLFSDFSDQEFRSRIENKFGDPEFNEGESGGGIAVFTATEDDEYEVDRDIKDRLESQQVFTIVGGGEYIYDGWTVDFSASYAYAEEEEPDRLDTDFRAKFDEGLFAVDVNDGILPALNFPDAAAEAAYFNPDNYEFDGLELTNGLSQDDEFAFAGNVQYDTDLFGGPGYLKFGSKIRLREKEFDLDLQVFDGFDGDDLLLTQFENTLEYDLDRINPVPDADAVRDFFFANRSSFELNAIDTAIESNIANYVANEDVYAFYGMAQRTFDNGVSLVAGLRVEHTSYDATGFSVLEQEFEVEVDGDVTGDPTPFIPPAAAPGMIIAEEIEAEFEDGMTAIEGARIFRQEQMVDNSYTDWLPSINLRWDADDEVVVRLGYHKSLARPNIEAAAPRSQIAQDEDDEVEGEFGNPNLKRQSAHNIDATIEWYPGQKSVISAGFFYKRINDFIALQAFEDITVNGVTFDEALTFVNLDDAMLYGFELNLQKPLDMLPAPFDGLIVNANYTFVDAEATLLDGREVPLPNQSQHVATGILGYEKGPVDLRFALTYRDEYLDVINAGGDGLDRFVDSHLQVDVSAKYKFTDQIKAFVEFKNINNEPFVATIRPDGFRRLNSQYEEYGFTAKFGVAFTL